jgi:N-acetyl-alpha-D-glucosaminyl L-malate synthase BshA
VDRGGLLKLRIALLCHPGFGGSARVAVELAARLSQRGHDVHLFARSEPFGASAFPEGVTFHRLDGGPAASAPGQLDVRWSVSEIRRAADGLARILAQLSIDIVHFHYADPFALIAESVSYRLGASCPALVGTLHGTGVTAERTWVGRGLLRRALTQLDAITTVSASHAELSVDIFKLPEPPLVVPNFVDPAQFHPVALRTEGPPRIVHISNFREVKDPERMARIFLALRRDVDVDLWLVGDGPLMPAVRAILACDSAAANVRFFGFRRQVQPILADADLLLLTSREESFSMAALEAAACAVPAVAPNVGGLPEVVGDGGVLYDSDDDQAAIDAALTLLYDPARRHAAVMAALARAALFSADAVVPRYETLYRRLLSVDARVLLDDSSMTMSPAFRSAADEQRRWPVLPRCGGFDANV